MKKGMKHSSSMKTKNTAQIDLLEDKLFNKLKTIQPSSNNYEDLQFKYMPNQADRLNDLIYRAKGLTSQNQDKIQKARKELRVSKKQSAGMFLTGTGIYAVQDEQQNIQQKWEQLPEPEMDQDMMLKELTDKNSYDDLEELRRMIKKTGENLNGYTREIQQTKKDVLFAANQFHSQMDYGLSCNLNKLRTPAKKKSSNSVACIKDSRYK